MSRESRDGLASIIVPCCGQRAFTQLCLQALFRHTHNRPDRELIVVDNGSTDGTAEYLEGIRDAAAVPVTVIANRQNLGFPAAVNQGLREARGEYLVLLNNDAVVTDGWLDQLVALSAVTVPGEGQGGGDAGSSDVKRGQAPGLVVAGGGAVGEADPHVKRGQAPGLDDAGVTADGIAAGSQSPFDSASPADSAVGDGDPHVKRGQAPGLDDAGVAADGIAAGSQSPFDSASTLGEGAGSQSPLASALTGDAGRPVGLVGPMSNYAAPPQRVDEVPYRDLDEMHVFAREWRERHRGQWFTASKLSGFCLLMKRSVYEAVGGLDERFEIGFFDDDDLAVRARRAGFELAVARDLFVHHYGSRTFVGNRIDAERLLEENARRFAEKWGDQAPAGRRVTLTPWGGGAGAIITGVGGVSHVKRGQAPGLTSAESTGDGMVAGSQSPFDFASTAGEAEGGICLPRPSPLTPRPCRVSLTMIVRDEEDNLPRCLGSVRGVFDEVVVVDTGSVDRTREIAREFGARVVEFAWIDDFAAARNAELDAASGDYAFWLDADDLVEPGQREKLMALLEGLRASDQAGYVVKCACDPGADGSGGETVVDHIRLFPLRPDVRWTYRVHEQILPALRRTGVPMSPRRRGSGAPCWPNARATARPRPGWRGWRVRKSRTCGPADAASARAQTQLAGRPTNESPAGARSIRADADADADQPSFSAGAGRSKTPGEARREGESLLRTPGRRR